MGIVNNNGVLEQEDIPKEDITQLEIIEQRNTNIEELRHSTVLSTARDKVMVDQLKGYIEGTPIKVTWFHQLSGNTATSSWSTNISLLSSSVNVSLLKIRNMEIRLSSPMDYQEDPETTQSELQGTAIIYPGFVPKLGDLFLYAISPTDIGVFRVFNNPKRLTYRNNTTYEVPFTLIKKLTSDDLHALETRTREVRYFDKKRFLYSDGGLLTEQEVLDKQFVKDTIDKLKRHYHSEFYNKDFSTFILNEDIYDPYLVHFYRKAVALRSNGQYVSLPGGSITLSNWDNSVYAKLLKEYGFGEMVNTIRYQTIEYNHDSPLISILIGKRCVELIDADDIAELDNSTEVSTYLPSSVVNIDPSSLSDFDKLITLYLLENKIFLQGWKDVVESVGQMSREEQFYRIPMLIYIGNRIIDDINYGAQTNMIDEMIDPYLEAPFTNENVTDGIAQIPSLYGKVLAIKDEQGHLFNADDSIATLENDTLSVNIQFIFDARGITEVQDTWYFIIQNTLADTL